MSWNKIERKKLLLLAVKLLIAGLVGWFILSAVWDARRELADFSLQLRPAWLLLAGGLYLAGLLPAWMFWHRTLRAMGQSPRWGDTLRAYFIGHLGKYVPGKAMVVVLRVGLLRGRGADAKAAAVSVVYETLTMMAVGAFLAAALLAVWFKDQTFFALIALGLASVAVVPTLPPVFRRLAKMAGIGRDDAKMLDRLDQLGPGSLAFGWLTIALGWTLMGLSLWATLRGLGILDGDGQPPDLLRQLPLCVAAVSLAMVAGFLSLIPGGALVRESILIGLMPRAGFAKADIVVAAVALRLIWLAAELAISAVLYAWRRRLDSPTAVG